MFRS
jgi:hypothetical protein